MNTSTKIATINGLATNNSQCGFLKLNIHTATGGHFEINMPEKESVSTLKWRLARKLKISGEKISLLFQNRPLKEGSLQDNLVTDNSKILLLPNMESGMTFQRPEVGVIQGLENLTESQVNDFLSGRAPLLLVIKLGDHMMFVQLQLSTASCAQSSQTNRSQCTVDGKEKVASGGPMLNSAALAELGHNLSQKLREFSQLSTHQRVPEHCISGSPVPSHSNPPSSTPSTYSVTKNGTVNGHASHTQSQTPAIINNNNINNNNNNSSNSTNSNSNSNNNNNSNSNHSHNLNNTSLTQSNPCNPSIPCATTTAGPAPVSRNCPTTGEPLQGAIIESMHHIGQGVYSGTFSGTLDPSLQDMDGKPKRNISTIIHILNDLLGATPQYRAPSASHTVEKIAVDNCTHKNSEQSAQLVGLSEQDNALRGKIKDLQMKMEEKRMRRQARRDAKAPYQCHGPRPNTFFNLPTSTTTTTGFDLNTDTDICSTGTDLRGFVAPQLPECTVTEMDIGEDSIEDGKDEGENREIEMTAMPTQTTATATGSSSAGSTKPAEPSAYANPGLEQESVLV